jgi:hypothetical protein
LFLKPLTRLCLRPPTLSVASRTHAISRSQNFNVLSLPRSATLGCRSLSKACAKIRPFSKPANFFFAFLHTGRPKEMSDSGLRQKKFFQYGRIKTEKHPKKTKKHTNFSQNSGSYHLEKVKIRIFIWKSLCYLIFSRVTIIQKSI